MSETEQEDVTITSSRTLTGDPARLLAAIGQLVRAKSTNEVMAVATEAARDLLGADGITFVLRDGDSCYYADEDAIAPLWKGRRFPVDACISGWCMAQRKAAIVPDIALDPRIPQDAYRPTFVRSLLMVPVRREEPMAAMGAYWARSWNKGPPGLDPLHAIADASALAVVNVELEQRAREAEAAEQRHRLVAAEVGHRFKNLLAVVASLARQTLSRASSLDSFSAAFTGRLQTLARAQALLLRSNMASAQVREVIHAQLVAAKEREQQIYCHGPDVFLAADEAFDLGLVLYELGTNAHKYGALSTGEGRIEVRWAVRPDGSMLELSWREYDGPPVVPPVHEGFGGTLIAHAFRNRGGHVRLHYRADGVVCEMRIPLPRP